MSDLPAPLTPSDCDLRGYNYMPLFGQKLFGSKLYMKSLRNPRAGMAAIKLWWAAWQQCPAASLPDDDEDLSILADFGMDLEGWKAIRDIALHGFVKCSDGRLYHPMLAQEAISSFESRKKDRERKAQQRAKKAAKATDTPPSNSAGTEGQNAEVANEEPLHNSGTSSPCPRDVHGTSEGQDAEVRSDRTGQDSKDITLTSFVTPPSPPSREVVPAMPDLLAGENVVPLPPDARTVLFRQGLDVLVRMTGKPPNAARKLLGKWLKAAKDNAQLLNAILMECSSARPADAIPWIEGAIRNRTGSKLDAMARDWRLDEIDLDAAAEEDCRRLGI